MEGHESKAAGAIQRMEVEQKFPVEDLTAIQSKLVALGADVSPPRSQVDLYYAHPVRDFAATDEALRIRQTDRSNSITYKGPKIDATTKTRREIDLPLPEGTEGYALWAALLEAVGFRPIAEVRKERRKALVAWEGRQVEVSLDRVEQLGTFVELELVTGADDVAPAKACLGSLARHLGLSGSERQSYLELLLARRRA